MFLGLVSSRAISCPTVATILSLVVIPGLSNIDRFTGAWGCCRHPFDHCTGESVSVFALAVFC